jgi:hypothetical protein
LTDSGVGFAVTPSNSGGNAQFTLTDPTQVSTSQVNYVFRIEGDLYNGFFVVQAHTLVSGLISVYGSLPYTGNSAHTIYPQAVNYKRIPSREIIITPNIDVNSINSGSTIYGNSNIKLIDANGTYPQLTTAWGYFAKPTIGTAIDNYKINLNYGTVLNITSFSFGQFYHQGLQKVITSPRAVVNFLFKQSSYNNLSLARFIYLKTMDFEGYFLITKIDGYKNPFTPVKAELILWQ